MEENDDSPPEGVLTQRALGWELIAQDLCNELVGTVVRLVEEKKDILMAEARSLESLRKAVEEECRVKIEQTEKVIKEKSQNSEKDLQHIEAQKERLQDEIAEISKTTTSWGKIIKLNVGGKHFTSSASTLTRYEDSMLGRMFSGRHELAVDDEGRVFIDRKGEVFDSVLEFLRDGAAWDPPTDELVIRRLQREFEYFQLPYPLGPSVFIIGGSHGPGSSTSLQAVQRYDIVAKNWSVRANLVLPRQHAPAVVLDGKIYLIGGEYGSDGTIRLASVDRYDPSLDAWVTPTVNTTSQSQPTTIASLATKKSAFSAIATEGVIYAMGGYDGTSSVKNMERYDPHTNQWIQCTPMGTARHGFAAAALDGALYIMGGSTSLAAVERYDERTGQWTSLPVLLTGRDFLAAVAVDGAVFSIGGRRDKLAQNKVERFDARNNRWMPVASLMEARLGHGAVVVDGKIIVLGGWDGTTDKVNIESYDPKADVWSCEGALTMGKRYFGCVALE